MVTGASDRNAADARSVFGFNPRKHLSESSVLLLSSSAASETLRVFSNALDARTLRERRRFSFLDASDAARFLTCSPEETERIVSVEAAPVFDEMKAACALLGSAPERAEHVAAKVFDFVLFSVADVDSACRARLTAENAGELPSARYVADAVSRRGAGALRIFGDLVLAARHARRAFRAAEKGLEPLHASRNSLEKFENEIFSLSEAPLFSGSPVGEFEWLLSAEMFVKGLHRAPFGKIFPRLLETAPSAEVASYLFPALGGGAWRGSKLLMACRAVADVVASGDGEAGERCVAATVAHPCAAALTLMALAEDFCRRDLLSATVPDAGFTPAERALRAAAPEVRKRMLHTFETFETIGISGFGTMVKFELVRFLGGFPEQAKGVKLARRVLRMATELLEKTMCGASDSEIAYAAVLASEIAGRWTKRKHPELDAARTDFAAALERCVPAIAAENGRSQEGEMDEPAL